MSNQDVALREKILIRLIIKASLRKKQSLEKAPSIEEECIPKSSEGQSPEVFTPKRISD